MALYDSAVNLIVANDDINFSAGDIGSGLGFTPTVTGTYYIDVDAYPDQTGGYTLNIQSPNADGLDPLDSLDWGTQLSSTNVTVYFAAAGERFDGVTSLGWSQYEIDQAVAALQTWADVSNLTFTVTSDAASATFKLVTTESNEFLGYFNPPGTFNAGVGVFAVNGDGWDTTGGLEPGGYGWITLVHEFGHGLGLAHPHDNGGTSSVMAGVTSPFGSYGMFDLNQGIYTTMSYNDGWQLHPSGTNSSLHYGWQAGPGALDIGLIQIMYGASSANTGDNIYVLPATNAAGTYWDVIWDTGGIDTIAHSGTVAATIDLTAATLDYSATGGGAISYVGGIFGGFTIAAGVVIENASGGSGADILIGNAADNLLEGGAGNDTLNGGGGADTLEGGSGADTLGGGEGADIFVYRTDDGADTIVDFEAGDVIRVHGYTSVASIVQVGSDTVITFASGNQITVLNSDSVSVEAAIDMADVDPGRTIVGTPGADTLNGGNGNDEIYGLDGNDQIFGGGGDDWADGGLNADMMHGEAGNDTLIGSNGHDKLYGGDGHDVLRGGRGNDQLYGGEGDDDLDGGLSSDVLHGDAGNDTLVGGDGHDTLYGGAGDDTLKGGRGTDVLEGGAGRDILFGGLEADTFVFRDGDFAGLTASTSDRINDFRKAQSDKIDLALVDADTLTGGDQAFNFIGTGGFSNVAGQLRYETVSGNTHVYGDTDGNGVADFMILLTGTHTLNAGDFVI